jgi:hypothetical protein
MVNAYGQQQFAKRQFIEMPPSEASSNWVIAVRGRIGFL